MVSTAAIILAGGRGSRLGGVRKADLRVGGERLLDTVLAAVAGSSPRIVVGYEDLRVPAGVILTREHPPGSGPAAAVAAGMARVGPGPEWVFTLACDLPGVGGAVSALVEAARAAGEETEAISASPNDSTEWLVALVRTRALRAALAAHGDVVDGSMRRLYAPLTWHRVAVPQLSTRDIDTWEDHHQWQKLRQQGERT